MIESFYSKAFKDAITRSVSGDAEAFCPEGEATLNIPYIQSAHFVVKSDAFMREVGERIRVLAESLRSTDENTRMEASVRMKEIEEILMRFNYLDSLLPSEEQKDEEDLIDIQTYESNPSI